MYTPRFQEDCDQLYNGETKQPLLKRMAQHRKASSSGQESADYTYLQVSGHSFRNEDVLILDKGMLEGGDMSVRRNHSKRGGLPLTMLSLEVWFSSL